MPICPSCKREYGSGIIRCEDCAVDLVDTPASALEEKDLEETALELVELAEFMNPAEAEMIRELLETNHIRTVLRGEVDPIGLASGAAPSTLLVKRSDLARANTIYEDFFGKDTAKENDDDDESGNVESREKHS